MISKHKNIFNEKNSQQQFLRYEKYLMKKNKRLFQRVDKKVVKNFLLKFIELRKKIVLTKKLDKHGKGKLKLFKNSNFLQFQQNQEK